MSERKQSRRVRFDAEKIHRLGAAVRASASDFEAGGGGSALNWQRFFGLTYTGLIGFQTGFILDLIRELR